MINNRNSIESIILSYTRLSLEVPGNLCGYRSTTRGPDGACQSLLRWAELTVLLAVGIEHIELEAIPIVASLYL